MATEEGGARHFSTFMKARIFCDKPSTLEFADTLDYVYNSITSFVFSEEGRYYDNSESPTRLLYGSFTGPSNGPVGSALCVYPADNSVETSAVAGRTKSVFDIFREDITSDLEDTTVENAFVECAPEGRDVDDQRLLFINPDVSVEQIGNDPILVLDDVIVNRMVQDTVCVVTRGDRTACVNQDVLFLGLDSGHVLKVVFGLGDDGETVPVISEDIELDPEDPRNVTDMKLRSVGGEKFLFVSTDTRVYKLPVQRCGRFPKCRCSECVATRDPYCVYNMDTYMCELNLLSPSLPVDNKYRQNIHDGTVESSCDCPRVGISPPAVAVGEGEGSVTFVLSSTRLVSVYVKTVSGTAVSGEDYVEVDSPFNISTETNVTVGIVDDVALETAQEFNLSLSSDSVYFERDQVSVTILDNDGESGVPFSILFDVLDLRDLSLSCDNQLKVDDQFTSDMIGGVVSGVRSQCCHDFSSAHIIKHSSLLSCNQDKWQLLFQAEMVSTETANTSLILVSLATWAEPGPLVAASETGVQLRPNDVCTSDDKSCSKAPPLSGLSSDSNQRDAFIAVLVLFLIVSIVCCVLGAILIVTFCRHLRNSADHDNSDGIRKYPRKLSQMLFQQTKIKTPSGTLSSDNGSQASQTNDPSSSLRQLVSPPTSSLTSQTSRQLDTVPEEEEPASLYFTPANSLNPSVYRSADDEMKKNVAYGRCGVEKGENGEEKTDIETENGETCTNSVL
ncbi:Semaphorin-1A [Geodia barretti]|nr:Semaphorin-1A [Geodia barretti]